MPVGTDDVNEPLPVGVRSIHYIRRWFYVLWCGLLLGSLVALGLWNRPVNAGTADLTVGIRVMNVPPGCTAQIWAGPTKSWPSADLVSPLTQHGTPLTADGIGAAYLKLHVGYRRWIGGVIPSRTDELVVMKFQPKSGPPRYFPIPLGKDWHTRLLRPGQRMGITTTIDWDGLWPDPDLMPKSN